MAPTPCPIISRRMGPSKNQPNFDDINRKSKNRKVMTEPNNENTNNATDICLQRRKRIKCNNMPITILSRKCTHDNVIEPIRPFHGSSKGRIPCLIIIIIIIIITEKMNRIQN